MSISGREPGYYWARLDEEDEPEPCLMIDIDDKGKELWTRALTDGAYAEDQVFWIGPRIDRDETERLKAEIETLKAQSMNNAGNAMANYQAYERMLYQSADQDAENQRLKARVAELEAALGNLLDHTGGMCLCGRGESCSVCSRSSAAYKAESVARTALKGSERCP